MDISGRMLGEVKPHEWIGLERGQTERRDVRGGVPKAHSREQSPTVGHGPGNCARVHCVRSLLSPCNTQTHGTTQQHSHAHTCSELHKRMDANNSTNRENNLLNHTDTHKKHTLLG